MQHVVFYLAGPAAARTSILFISGVSVNVWRERCVAIGGRWLDLRSKREWQSLAVFCGVTIAHGLLMMINLCQLFTGWLCFAAALVRRSHRVGADCLSKAFTPLLCMKGGEVGLEAAQGKKTQNPCINLSKWLAYVISFWRFVSALPWRYYWFTVNLEVIGKALLMLRYQCRTAAFFFFFTFSEWHPSSFMSLQYLWISFLSLYSEA